MQSMAIDKHKIFIDWLSITIGYLLSIVIDCYRLLSIIGFIDCIAGYGCALLAKNVEHPITVYLPVIHFHLLLCHPTQ